MLTSVIFVITTFTLLGLHTKASILPFRGNLQQPYPGINADENVGVLVPPHVHGDIVMETWPEETLEQPTGHSKRQKRSFGNGYLKTWYNRTVPYIFDSEFSTINGLSRKAMVMAAIADIENNTCIRFKPRTTERDYLAFVMPDAGCWSHVGLKGGRQDVTLGHMCFNHGTIIHEILHALGLWHEHTRMDRDDYITVIKSNIREDNWLNFQKRSLERSHPMFQNMRYDYNSVMHYSNITFALDKTKPSIVPTKVLPPGVILGQRFGLSEGDIEKLNALYRCDIQNCSDPSPLADGVIEGSDYSVGSRITYRCLAGYQLVGPSERVCGDIGEWSGYSPACLPTGPNSQNLHYCNFDSPGDPMCGWTQMTDDPLNWTIHSGPTLTLGTGPPTDHTLNTRYGQYVYLEASETQAGWKSALVSPPLLASYDSATCLTFFAYMYGLNMGSLSVYNTTVGNTRPDRTAPIFILKGDQGEKWVQALVPLGQIASSFQIILEGTIGEYFLSDIAVDDIVVAPCYTFKPLARLDGLPHTVECTFDSGLCTFIQDRQDDIDWTLQMGRTPTFNTGPDCDPINCLTGKYLYLEASLPNANGDKAKLRTPTLGGEGYRCLTFYYHMYGDHIGSLKVELTDLLTGQEYFLWSASGNQGKKWTVQHVDFMSRDAYEISFEATVRMMRGDIAIDSISVTEGRCVASLRFNCSFEHDFCGWQNARDPVDTRDWTRKTGETDTPGTGPQGDRVHPNGYYAYVESSRSRPGDMAQLVSPSIQTNSEGGHCLTFWYHLYGNDIGNFSVIKQTEIGHSTTLWSVSGNQGNLWHEKRLNITHRAPYTFDVIFEASVLGHLGDAAIDDISIQSHFCTQ